MPIRYAKDIVVDQATVDLMSKAFNDALERLRLSRVRPDHEPEWVRRLWRFASSRACSSAESATQSVFAMMH